MSAPWVLQGSSPTCIYEGFLDVKEMRRLLVFVVLNQLRALFQHGYPDAGVFPGEGGCASLAEEEPSSCSESRSWSQYLLLR